MPASPGDILVQGNRLARADVILARNLRNPFSRAIAGATGGHWSHAAIVFVIPHADAGFDNAFILESVEQGVDLTNLRAYLDDTRRYDVGVKRLEVPWFSDPALDAPALVRGHMLNHIKADYDVPTIWTLFKSLVLKWSFLRHLSRRRRSGAVTPWWDRHKQAPARFICSGFVQYGFFETARTLVRRGALAESDLNAVFFLPDGQARDTASLLSATPQDLHTTPKLAWKYLVRGGRVYEVSSTAEVDSILKAGAGGRLIE